MSSQKVGPIFDAKEALSFEFWTNDKKAYLIEISLDLLCMHSNLEANHNPIMNILVCISHVPDTTAKINFTADGTSLDPAGVQFVINPYDEFGLTKALHLKEAQGGSITVINVGPATTEPTPFEP